MNLHPKMRRKSVRGQIGLEIVIGMSGLDVVEQPVHHRYPECCAMSPGIFRVSWSFKWVESVQGNFFEVKFRTIFSYVVIGRCISEARRRWRAQIAELAGASFAPSTSHPHFVCYRAPLRHRIIPLPLWRYLSIIMRRAYNSSTPVSSRFPVPESCSAVIGLTCSVSNHGIAFAHMRCEKSKVIAPSSMIWCPPYRAQHI